MGRFWGAFVLLALTPYIVSHLGLERFAVWSIVFVLTGYISLTDFGIREGFTPFLSRAWERQEKTEINSIASIGFFFYLFFSLLFVGLVAVLGPILLSFLKIPASFQQEGYFALLGASIVFGISNIFGVFRSVLNGLQRMDIGNKIDIAVSFPNIAGTIYVLMSGYGLRGLIVNMGIVTILRALLECIFSKRLLPFLAVKPRFLRWSVFKRLFRYGIRVQVSNLSGLVNFRIDELLLAFFIGLSPVAFYVLGSRITMIARGLPTLLFSAVIPAAAALESKKDSVSLMKLYESGSKCLWALAIPIGVFLFWMAPWLMRAWMGEGYATSVLVIRFLVIGIFFNILTGMASSIGRGIMQVNYEMWGSLVVASLNLVLSLILIIRFGLVGALVGTTSSLILGTILFFHLFHRHVIHDSFFRFAWRVGSLPLVFSLLSVVIGILAVLSFQNLFSGEGRAASFSLILFAAFVFSGSYLFLIMKKGYFEKKERDLFGRFIFFWRGTAS